MGVILTSTTSKGGGGKTALTIVLSVRLVDAGFTVAVLDGDPNGDFLSWHGSNYEGRPFLCEHQVDSVRIIDRAQELAETHDVVLIDTAGFSNLTAQSAMATSDLVLIPCMADSGSVREAMKTGRRAQSLARAAKRDIPFYVVCTRWKSGGLAESAALADLERAGLPILKQHLSDLAGWKKMTFSGEVPRAGKALDEICSLIVELESLALLPTPKVAA